MVEKSFNIEVFVNQLHTPGLYSELEQDSKKAPFAAPLPENGLQAAPKA